MLLILVWFSHFVFVVFCFVLLCFVFCFVLLFVMFFVLLCYFLFICFLGLVRSPFTFIIWREAWASCQTSDSENWSKQVWNNVRLSKWCQDFHFCVNDPFISHMSPLRCSHIFNNSAFTDDHQSLCFIGAVDFWRHLLWVNPHAGEQERWRGHETLGREVEFCGFPSLPETGIRFSLRLD